jgi:hypothetical protein
MGILPMRCAAILVVRWILQCIGTNKMFVRLTGRTPVPLHNEV